MTSADIFTIAAPIRDRRGQSWRFALGVKITKVLSYEAGKFQ